MSWYPRACPVCGGDLYDDVLDEGWRSCMMCARSFASKELISLRKAPITLAARSTRDDLQRAA